MPPLNAIHGSCNGSNRLLPQSANVGVHVHVPCTGCDLLSLDVQRSSPGLLDDDTSEEVDSRSEQCILNYNSAILNEIDLLCTY